MAKQPKPEDATKETKAEVTPAQTGKTMPVGTENLTASTVHDLATPPDTVPTSETGDTITALHVPEIGVNMSDAVRQEASKTLKAALEEGKSPEGQIMVIGPKGGRWRAGRHFGPEPTIIDVADLTEEEGRALISDPKLVVGPAFPGVAS